MDAARFDRIAKAFATGLSRRSAARLIVAGALAGTLPARAITASAARATRPKRMRTRCREDRHCDGGVCVDGQCRCATGQFLCNNHFGAPTTRFARCFPTRPSASPTSNGGVPGPRSPRAIGGRERGSRSAGSESGR